MVVGKAVMAAVAANMSTAAAPPKPVGDPAQWITTNDYPASALRAAVHGTVGVAVFVDQAGIVLGCSVARPSGSDVLDDVTCLLMRDRARFDPARGPLGRKIAGIYRQTVRWQLPNDEGKPIEGPAFPLREGDVTVQFDVDAAGLTSRCATVTGGTTLLQADPCEAFQGTRFESTGPDGRSLGARRVFFQTSVKVVPCETSPASPASAQPELTEPAPPPISPRS